MSSSHYPYSAGGGGGNGCNNDDEDDDDDDPTIAGSGAAAAAAAGKRGGNTLPMWGSVQTMNLNPLILTNIQGSPYFKVNLFELKTYHEVVDEIFYKVAHLEPWERGSRKTAGQTGMCGGVRGVGAGGIVSSAFCLLYKLSTLKLTRKQVNGLINHCDSPYIRGLGFMYIRYTQPPTDLWDWYEEYLDDDEEIDVKAGGGKTMKMGEMVRAFMEKLEWFDTRFPRIPVHVQEENKMAMVQPVRDADEYTKQFVDRLAEMYPNRGGAQRPVAASASAISTESHRPDNEQPQSERLSSRERSERNSRERKRSRERDRDRSKSKAKKRSRSRSRNRDKKRSRSRDKDRKRSRSRDREKKQKHKKRSRSRERHKHHKHDRDRSPKTYEDDLRSYSEYRSKHKKHKRSRSKSR